MELLLVKATYANPNNVLPEQFPGKGELVRFPMQAFVAWNILRKINSNNIDDDPQLKNCLIDRGITEDLNLWARILDIIKEKITPLSQEIWTDGKYDLYIDYLIDPRTCCKKNPECLGKEDYYPPLSGYEQFTLWKLLVRYIEEKFKTYPIPYNEERVKYCDRFKDFKNRIESDECRMFARHYAEFLAYCLPTKYLRLFILENLNLFPGTLDLINMYRQGLQFDYEFLKDSWYVFLEGFQRVKYGETKFEEELNLLFGINKYIIINV